jgi:hypothetical protein
MLNVVKRVEAVQNSVVEDWTACPIEMCLVL